MIKRYHSSTNKRYIDFNTNISSITHKEGRLHWDDDDGTLVIDYPGGNVMLQIGQEGLVRVSNQSGSTIPNGKVVYVTGSQGNRPTIDLADNTDSDKLHILGMTTEDIDDNNNGYVNLYGYVRGDTNQPINTSSFSEGDKLYLNTAGGYTATHPTGVTDATIIFGSVTKVHATDGVIHMTRPETFTIGNNFDGILRQSVINKNTGTSAASTFTAVNDAGHRGSFSLSGTNHSVGSEIFAIYNEGYGRTAFVNDGNVDFVWHSDPTDSHNGSSFANEIMKLQADGELILDTTRNVNNRLDFYNGTFAESFDALITSNGTVITLTLTNAVSGNLIAQFSDADVELTMPYTVALNLGADDAPQENWAYILKSDTSQITLSTSGYPTDVEHIKINFSLVQSASKVQSDGALINQNWNDHLMNGNNMGHMAHIAEVLRLGLGYNKGIDPNGNDGSGTSYYNQIGAAEGYFKATSGITYQLHRHETPALDTQQAGDDIHVVNWSGDPYHEISNIADIVTDSAGGSLSNKYFNVFFFITGNKTGQYAPVMAKLAGGSYVSEVSARNDVDSHDDLIMPRQWSHDSSVGIPICRMTFRWTGGTSTLAHIATRDLREGGSSSGSAAGAETDFADNQFSIFNVTDITKIIDFDASPISSGFTRTIAMADENIDLADIPLNNTHRGLTNNPHSVTPTQLSLVIGTDVQAWSTVLDNTTASYTTAEETKLSGIETAADVTDTANVTAAGALMDSEVDADIKTLVLPASTTISTFGASLVDDADAATARTTLGITEPKESFKGSLENPVATDEFTLGFTNKAITITEIRAVLVGSSTPSVTWTIRHSTDRSATGNEVVTSGTVTTSISTGSDVTSFNDATIPADSFVWLEVTAQSGTVTEFALTAIADID